MPKQKTHKGTKKRFRITAKGKVKHRRSGTSHLQVRVSSKRKRNLRGTGVLDKSDTANIVEALASNSYWSSSSSRFAGFWSSTKQFSPKSRYCESLEGLFMRTKNAVPRLRAKRRLLKRVKGSVGGRRRLLRTAKESVIRAGVFAKRDRRRRKRDFRRLWIIRINAACRERGLRYSQFIAGLEKIGCELDRRTLSEMAVLDPTGFDVVVSQVREGLGLPEAVVA